MSASARAGGHFFIIGAQRSGTTSLYHMLDAHPDVAMARPIRPEPKFFLDRGSDSGEALARYEKTYFGAADAHWYGEKSTTYIERPDAAARIATAYPDARIIVSLREPAARAMSNYRFSVDNGFESRDLSTALNSNAPPDLDVGMSTSPFDYAGRSRYENHLPSWLDRFGSNMCILIFEELLSGAARGQVESLLELATGSLRPFPVSNESPMRPGGSEVPPTQLQDEFDATITWVEQLLGREIPAWHRAT